MAFQKDQFPALDMNVEKVVLEKYMFGASARISREVLRDLQGVHRDLALRQGKLYTEIAPVLDQLLITVRSFLLKSQHTEKETLSVSTPATWFDHFKHDWLESGVSWKRWVAGKLAPPQYKAESRTVDKIVRVCPHNDTYFSKDQTHIEWLLWRHDLFPAKFDDGNQETPR